MSLHGVYEELRDESWHAPVRSEKEEMDTQMDVRAPSMGENQELAIEG